MKPLQPPWQRSHLSLPADCRDVRPPRSHSCIIDGACDDNGITSFNRGRYRRHDESIFLYAFDLIELNADDLRRDPLIGREATLEIMLAKAGPGIRFQ
jgi:ATP-dependent DNA ligase